MRDPVPDGKPACRRNTDLILRLRARPFPSTAPWPNQCRADCLDPVQHLDRPLGASMRLALLARNPNLYSHQRLVAEAQARGHTIDVINTLQVHMNITSSK